MGSVDVADFLLPSQRMECVTRTGRAGSAKPKNNSSKDKRREYKEKNRIRL